MAYIAFEGGDGSGKSTQAERLARRIDAVLTREPGGTPLGTALRELLLDHSAGPLAPRAEALLMAADRAQHMADVVSPALAAGRHVVSDRTVYSSLAYQGGGRELGVDAVRAMNDFALGGVWPDLVVMVEIDERTRSERMHRELDQLEAAGDAFHRRVADVYRQLAASEPDRFVVIDGDGPIDDVQARVWLAVAPVIGEST